MRRVRFVLLLLTAVPLVAASPAVSQVMPDSLRLDEVEFEGNDAFPSQLLSTAIFTTPTHCNAVFFICWFGVAVDHQYYDEILAEQDALRLRVFYYKRGYRDARVELERENTPEGIVLTYRIVEGEPVRVSEVTVNGEGVPPELGRNLPLRTGMPFDLDLYELSRDTLELRLENRGHAAPDVLANYDAPGDSLIARVFYEVFPGTLDRFGSIDVVGAERVSPAVVRRMLTFEEGDVYSREALLRSQRNLFSQELFRHADIRTYPGVAGEDSVLAVEVRLVEGDVHRVRAGMGLSSAEYLTTEGRWVSRNFMGGARRLEARAQISNLLASSLSRAPFFDNLDQFGPLFRDPNGQVALDFRQPWFFGPLNTLNAGVYAERRSIPGVFVRTGGGGNLTFQRRLGDHASLDFGVRPELTKLETASGDLVFCLNFTVCDERQIEALSKFRWLVPLTGSVVWDRSNSLFAPNRGWVIRVNGEYADAITGSDFEYARIAADFIDYSAISPRYILATRFSPGLAIPMQGEDDDDLGVHPTRRFYAGGPNSIRGYAQFRLGPKALTIDPLRLLSDSTSEDGGASCTPHQVNAGTCDAGPLARENPRGFNVQPLGGAASFEGSVELRFPVFRELVRGVAFIDYGNVWSEVSDMSFRGMDVTPGLGVRYFSPIGPIRVDIGYNSRGAEIVPVFTTRVGVQTQEDGTCEPLPDVLPDGATYCDTDMLQAQPAVSWNPRRGFWRKLQFHFSIGQAF